MISPNFAEYKSFLQNGDRNFFRVLVLPGDFSGVLKLRGQSIHRFLQQKENRSPRTLPTKLFSQVNRSQATAIGPHPLEKKLIQKKIPWSTIT